MLSPIRLSFIIFSVAIETSSMKTGWNLVKPSPNKGTKNEDLKIGNNLFKNKSPPPIITPGLITIVFLIFLNTFFSDL